MASRIILVTGSNDGIGYELVRLLAQQTEGHKVYLSSRNEEKGKEAQAKLKAEHGVEVKYVQLDVTDEKSILAAKALIEKEEGRLDVLVNNAGILSRSPAAIADLPAFRTQFETNFFGLISTTTAFIPLLRQSSAVQGFAVILNVTSGLSSNANQAKASIRNPGPFSPYSASKAALNAYTISLGHELKPENIRVNVVTPGITATNFNGFLGNRTAEDGARVLLPFALLGAEDADKTVLFHGPDGEMPW
ncbi:hypothetical protein BDP27DRAFT_1393838, partial [Rhodocollybia butyracea]